MHEDNKSTTACGATNIDNKSQDYDESLRTTFDWDEWTQGLILSSFSWGYIVTQLLGGRMAEKFGTKKVYGICLFLSGIFSFISPWVTKWHFHAFMVLRAIQGALHGVTWPSLHALTARWVPVAERGGFIAKGYFGSAFGTVIMFPLCGAIVQAWGWEMAFHIIGVWNSIWFACWWLLVFDTPDKHPRISNTELNHLHNSLGNDVEMLPIPWKGILLSKPFWSLIATDFADTWGLLTLLIYFPTYLKVMLGFDIASTGLLSSLPMICRYLGGLTFSYIADKLIAKQKLSVTNVRKVFQSIAEVMTALTMVIAAFTGCNPFYAIALQCIGFFFKGAIASGCLSSYIDLSPNFSGTLFGIGNTFSGGGAAFLIPLVVGSITQDNMTFNAWKTVFLLAAGLLLAGNAIYCIFITGEVQEWNYCTRSQGKQFHELQVKDGENVDLAKNPLNTVAI